MGRQRLAHLQRSKKMKRVTHHCKECGRKYKIRADCPQVAFCEGHRCGASQVKKDTFMVRKVEEKLRG